MAWTDQCKIAFKTNADALLWKQKGKKGVMKILKDLSGQSGIPQKTLYHWWKEMESLKNQTNGEVVENIEESGDSKKVQKVQEPPICYRCEKSHVHLTQHGNPYSKKSAYFGLCNGCRIKQYRLKAVDLDAEEGNRIETVCPYCDKIHYINRERIE